MDNATEYMAGINPPSEVEQLRTLVQQLERKILALTMENHRLEAALKDARGPVRHDWDRY
jgi:Ni,Fe-hydrogenase III large subunit